jgi:hypothetical protein
MTNRVTIETDAISAACADPAAPNTRLESALLYLEDLYQIADDANDDRRINDAMTEIRSKLYDRLAPASTDGAW